MNVKGRAGTPATSRILGVMAGLAIACVPGAAAAQETGGKIFGWGPAGQTVAVQSTSGTHRHVTIGDNGRYSIPRLPLGMYTVTLQKNGQDVDTRSNIGLQVGRGAEVDFACPDDRCEKQS